MQLPLFVYKYCMCVHIRLLRSVDPTIHALLLIFPLPALLSSHPFLFLCLHLSVFAHRPVHCSTPFPLRQRGASFCIHPAAACSITILRPSAAYSENIQIHAA
ncbi:hypothetical protein ILYODFUR_036257 [Ilyodon furcidens]|uniref:Uncharacterized protein n=1 Tax=Ilyodon furcidens TaxID=33524 RepID=A0ABV0V1W7_9TELE